MLSKAKHLAFSGCYKVEILRLTPQNDIATQSPPGEGEGEGKVAPPSPLSSPSKRRARRLSQEAAKNVRAKKDFGIKAI
jgi:hypothetical protein